MTGVITAYNKQRGFGLISQEMVVNGIYFDIADCKARGLYVGSEVEFEIATTKRGVVAKNITGMPRLRLRRKPIAEKLSEL
ncbi:cold shock domain-containing protein [Pedobacter sandarakinus]|uniref:cold shock domain-containing protein n=1 Tax=Pedobacter sandarakinus TaxID=353156 RepID=UPI00224565F7|nr:cold shock domain-containing protein [Pedobacter sandarakinus]MCX2574969.1 cold shock domain-containing protein [Pedobacter sandarakinus]